MNPYEVLGVSPNDDEETIKKAYRTLVKKYHPDRYANSPLAEEANEKLKEINLAYDMICGKGQPQQAGAQSAYSGQTGGYYGGASFSASFESVRMLISMGQLAAAQAMLSQLEQNAEWYYLMGVIFMRRGWYQNAKEYISRAISMDPQNSEYRAAGESFAERAQTYKSYSTKVSPLACCATSLCCSNFCCRGCFCI